jgi:hypothetical protein
MEQKKRAQNLYNLPPMYMKMSVKNTIGFLAIVCFLFMGLVGIVSTGGAQEQNLSSEELHRQANEAREKARRLDCKRVAERIAGCYGQEATDSCEKYQAAIVWFTNQYGESPDFSCPTSGGPFGDEAAR